MIGALTGLGLLVSGCGLATVDDETTRDQSGAITETGELGAFSIKVGDCLGGALDGEIEAVDGIPCGEAHGYEVYHVFDLAEGDGSFPGDTEVATQADKACYDAFAPFVGTDYESSELDYWHLVPTVDSWDQLDDREVLCLIGNLDGSPITGTARGAAR